MADSVIFSAFNTTTTDALHQLTRRHITYVGRTRKSICFRPADFIVSAEEECYYVSSTETCFEFVHIFNYLKILVCDLKIGRTLLGAAKIVTFTTFVVFLGVFCMVIITKYFLLPNMLTLSHNLTMSGYKFSIIMNSFMLLLPNFFHSLFHIECVEHGFEWSATMEPVSMRICVIFGQMVPLLLIGFMIISFSGNYRAPQCSLLANTLVATAGQIYIYLISTYETFVRNVAPQPNYVLRMRIHCGIMLLIYLGNLFAHIYFWRRTIEEDKAKEMRRRQSRLERLSAQKRATKSLQQEAVESITMWEVIMRYFFPEPVRKSEPPPAQISTVEVEVEPEVPMTALSIIYFALNPFKHLEQWSNSSKILVYPLWVILAVLIPVFDDDRPLNGWCKHLLCCSVMATLVYFYQDNNSSPFWYIVAAALIFILLLIIFKTSATETPKYYYCFAVLGTFNGLIAFYVLNAELRNMLYQILSYMNDWSRDALSLIVQPIGLCLSEGVFCWTLVTSHRPVLAYGAIFSLMFFTTFILLPELIFDPCFSAVNQMTITDSAYTSFVFIMITTTYILVSASMTNFLLRRSHAIFYLLLLSLYLIYSILANSDRIHPYGSQHSLLFEPAYTSANWA